MPEYIDKIMGRPEQRVLALALSSRLVVLSLMGIADVAFSDLDSSSHLQNFPCGGLDKSTLLPQLDGLNSQLARFLDGLAPWDSVYFVRIAKCGYETDMIHAFFPFLPFLMRCGAKFTGLEYISHSTSFPIESVYTALGLGINVLAFGIAALALYRLGNAVLGNDELSSLSVLLFCLNPASVFYSAAYTEALFAAFTWMGLVFLFKGGNGSSGRRGGRNLVYWAVGVLALALAGATRSNGILSAWFLIHSLFIGVYKSIASREKSKKNVIIGFFESFPWAVLLKSIVGCAVIWTPYLLMQVHGYRTFCSGTSSGSSQQSRPLWCSKSIPSLYGYVQETYWDVGFLRFYKYLNRWPWLLQSAPVFYIAIESCWMWISVDWKRALSLGLLSSHKKKKIIRTRKSTSEIAEEMATSAFLSDPVAPYVYHLAGMTAIALCMMHVNVATRFLSSSPALYWGAAAILLKALKTENLEHCRRHSLFLIVYTNWIWLWAMVFAVLGCLLFPNFFPWT